MRYLKYIVLIFVLFFYHMCFCQDWPKIYGGNVNTLIDRLFEDYDKGYLIGGSVLSDPNTFRYAWVIKTDINGNELWNKKYGNGIDQIYMNSCKKNKEQGLVVCGGTAVIDPLLDPLFFELNVCGEPLWCEILHSNDYNVASDIISIDDGYIGMLKYYGEGLDYARISLVKLNKSGEPLWIQQLAQEDSLIENEEGSYLSLTSDSNYLITGRGYHPGLHPFWILTDTSGIQMWDLFWSSVVGQANRVIEHDSGIFYATSWGITENRPQSPILFKFNSTGNQIAKYFLLGDTIVGGSSSGICSMDDSTLVLGITWQTIPFPVDNGYSVVFLTDTLGNLKRSRILMDEFASPQQIIMTSNKEILVANNYVTDDDFDIYLWKMNSALEDDTLYTQPLTYDSLCPYPIVSDTIDLDCSIFVNIDEIPTKGQYESTIKIMPDPARDWITLVFPDKKAIITTDLSIYNSMGKLVLSKKVQAGMELLSIDITSIPPGFYVAVCKTNHRKLITGKFIKTE